MEITTPTTHDPGCEAFRDDLASLAIGALTGLDRARVLAHLEECPHCTAEVEELSATADALTTLIPDATPPEGFADHTMDRIRADRAVPRRPVFRRMAAVAAVVVLVAVGSVVGATVASSGRHAPTTVVRTTSLHSSVGTKGTVLLVSAGHLGWLVMALHDAPMSGVVTCSITLADGSRQDVGQFDLTDGYGSWSVDLPVAASTVRTVGVVDDTGSMVASARVG
jgi:predicted anti-sigma-YlaC factor YlaD